jgi:uncharacterized protein (UPF0548 family)
VIVFGLHDRVLFDQLDQSRQEQVTYPEVGGTRWLTLPSGYHHDRLSLQSGDGESTWASAKDAIRLWRAHASARIRLTPADARIQTGGTVLASRTLGPLTILAPCRIVYVTDEPSQFGFAYGALPGHPERGEEAFHVVLGDDGTVTAEIVAFSRPADLPTKLAGPIGRKIQKAATRRYLKGIQDHLAGTK